MNSESLKKSLKKISELMEENKDYLVELDSQNGDGDLGISMANGYKAVAEMLECTEEIDLGKLMMQAARTFNEAAPSSLGTITSLCMMGMAKMLKGKEEATISQFATALEAGISTVMEKAKSKPGEKTILDSVCPALEALKENQDKGSFVAFEYAAKAAAKGSENTKNMRSVHGRAAYYGDKSIGVLDGGSVVGSLIFQGILQSLR